MNLSPEVTFVMEPNLGLSVQFDLTNPEPHFLYETLFHMRVAGKHVRMTVKRLAWVMGLLRELTVKVSSCILLHLMWLSSLVYLSEITIILCVLKCMCNPNPADCTFFLCFQVTTRGEAHLELNAFRRKHDCALVISGDSLEVNLMHSQS